MEVESVSFCVQESFVLPNNSRGGIEARSSFQDNVIGIILLSRPCLGFSSCSHLQLAPRQVLCTSLPSLPSESSYNMDSFAARSEHSFVAMAEQGSQQHRRRRSTQIPISPQYAQFPPHTKSASRFSMALSTPMKVSLSDDEVSGLYIPQWRTTGPRTHYIRRHICALTGWLVAFSLLFTLFYSVPTLPQSTLSKLQSLRRSQLAAAPAPVIQGTTIVSAFFAVQDGKKHRLDGRLERFYHRTLCSFV